MDNNLNTTAKVQLEIQDQQAKKKLAELEERAKSLKAKLADAVRLGDTRGVEKLNKEINKVNKEIRNVRTNAQNIEAAMKRVDQASPKELRRALHLINAELSSGRVQRGSKEWKAYCEQIKRVKRELAEVSEEMRDQPGLLSRISDGFNKFGGMAATAMASFAGVVMSGKTAVQAYADMEAEEANVRKFTGMTAEEVKRLNDEFKKMDTRTSREDLNKLAQEAGRLGKTSQEDVLGFVRAADQINVALDDLGEGATLTLSKLTGIFGDEKRLGTEKSLLAVGSVINELSQNCSASAPYLAEFAKRMAGVGAQANMTIPQVMGFAAVLDTQGQNVEASATAFSQLIMKLYKDPAKFARVAGLDVKEFSETLNKDANKAVIELLSSLKEIGDMDKLAPMFADMGMDGARASQVLGALAGNIEAVTMQQAVANTAFQEATSVTNEYNVQNNTVQAQLDKAKKGFVEMAVSLGEKLMPVMRYAISGSSMLMRVLSALVDFVIENKTAIISLAVGIGIYTMAVNASTIATKSWAAAATMANGVSKVFRVGANMLGTLFFGLTGQIRKATVTMRALSVAIKANPMGLLVSGVGAAVAAFASWRLKVSETRKQMEELRQEQEDFRKSLTDIDKTSASYSEKEVTRLKLLYKEATNEAKSKKERIAAATDLQTLYPEYFKNLSLEQIMVGQAKDQYDKLTNSIINSARARAAADKIQENEGKILELEEKLKKEQESRDQKKEDEKKKREEFNKVDKETKQKTSSAALGDSREMSSRENQLEISKRNNAQAALNSAKEATKAAEKLVKETENTIAVYEKANTDLAEKYNIAAKDAVSDLKAPDIKLPTGIGGGGYTSEKERKAQEKAQKEAEKKRKEAERKKKETIKQDLEDAKAAYLKESASNMAERSIGSINYLQYVEKKYQADLDYIAKRKEIYEKANLEESDDYAALLKEEEQLKAKKIDSERQATEFDVEQAHKKNEADIMKQFYDPKGEMFQSQQALNEALLEEDVRYLQEKRDLYEEYSEDWEKANAALNDRLAQDTENKQRELVENYCAFREKYEKLSFEERKKGQIRLLDDLLKANLITEGQYQKAVKELRDEYSEEETKRATKVKSEYTDMVLNLYNSFKDLFENIGKGGQDMWNSLSEAATSAYTVMAAVCSSYSSLVSADRDLELAKMEKYYDDEISKAGNNSKKKEKLEKEKEAETAKIKKKYNDRAMKIEIAQAIAQTAQAAIAAYASAAAIPVTGWIMAPIAAALATAAGAVQIATIKKQHQAEAIGYYEGGFTAGRNYRKEAGVVHEGEFVANHNAVNNPALSPVLRLIDYAQRNNTVGSLTAADVSVALGQGRGVSARGEVQRSTADRRASEGLTALSGAASSSATAIERLNNLLDEGIHADVIMDTERGLYRKLRKYEKILNNPKP